MDTSFVIRYFTADPPEQADAAALVIDSDMELAITAVGLAETWYVLRGLYGVPRQAAADALRGLITRVNVRVLGLPKEAVFAALDLVGPSGRVSMADALMWAEARESDLRAVYTFDERFPSEGLELRRS